MKFLFLCVIAIIGMLGAVLIAASTVHAQTPETFEATVNIKIIADQGYGYYDHVLLSALITPTENSPKGCSTARGLVMQPTDDKDRNPELPRKFSLISKPIGVNNHCIYDIKFEERDQFRLEPGIAYTLSADNPAVTGNYYATIIPITLQTIYPAERKAAWIRSIYYTVDLSEECRNLNGNQKIGDTYSPLIGINSAVYPGMIDLLTIYDPNYDWQDRIGVPAYADDAQAIPCSVQITQHRMAHRLRHTENCPPVGGQVQTVTYTPGMQVYEFKFFHRCLGPGTEVDNLHTSVSPGGYDDLLPPLMPDYIWDIDQNGRLACLDSNPNFITYAEIEWMERFYGRKLDSEVTADGISPATTLTDYLSEEFEKLGSGHIIPPRPAPYDPLHITC